MQSPIIFAGANFREIVKNSRNSWKLIPAKINSLKVLIKKPTCYKSNTPSCIDLILTNGKCLFELSNTFETGLSDHHKLVCATLKSRGFKGAPIEKIYRSYKTLHVNNFKNTLKLELEKVKRERCGEFEAVFKRAE